MFSVHQNDKEYEKGAAKARNVFAITHSSTKDFGTLSISKVIKYKQWSSPFISRVLHQSITSGRGPRSIIIINDTSLGVTALILFVPS